MSDDSEEDGPEFSGIIQPPLIHQLKSILDQYPDDGQILKEIIQNAEDAEASEMKVLFDERRVNEDSGTKEKAFKKYFKGPALCVYNNAKFTEQDWQGIQMIYQSVKEFDPVKVGRFGLGFKSVFHITDFPMIISGEKLLVIDPHQKDPGKVCISMKLNRLHKCIKLMETTYCLDALGGLFGFSQETLDTGDFQGTIFRFPLRNSASALSDNIYDAEKISDLFTAFESEASVELLFLKRLEKIELFRKSQGSDFAQPADSVFSVKIADECLDDVRQKRSEFHNYMRKVLLSVTDNTFTSIFNLTIVTETAEGESNKQDWLVIHCRKGRPLSEDLINLSQDESLSYSPYVSVAVPMVCDPEFIGHVFCLMPLPLENKSLTGYPVHVNGLFALDQNRRHVKWPSADQTKNKSHTDKPTRWNKCLVVEVLAYVYLMTLKELLRTCETSQFKQEDVDRVYRAVPDVREITSNWDLIVEPLFRSLVEIPFLFTSTNGDKWILPSQAVFSIFDGTNDSDVAKSVLKLAKAYGMDLVEAPEHITYMLRDRGIMVKTLSRDYIVNCLRSNPCYKSLTFDDKVNILLYLVNGTNFGCLNGLELLPLENGTFCSFGGTNKTYICHDKADLFPGHEASFLKQGINECVYTPLYKMAKQGMFQLCILEDQPANVIASLLQRTLQLSMIGDLTKTTVSWNKTGAVNSSWLKKVWKFMQRFSLRSFEHLHLIPDNRKNELCKPSKKFLLRCGQDHSISENISKCLEYFGITVLEDIPDGIEQHRDTRKYILSPTPANVVYMLGNVHGNDQVQKFNSSATKQERDELLAFLSKFNNFNSGVKELIRCMALYTEANSGRYVCIREVNRRVEMGSMPLKYFRDSLSCPTADHERLASLVNVPVIHEEDVIIDILSSLTREYSPVDINRMMDYVLRNHSRFYQKDTILNKARSIGFVRSVGGHLRRADELYDPEDDMAQSIIVDKSRFPNTSNLPVEVSLLRFIGLKSWKDIQAEDVMHCAKYIEHNPRDITSKSRSKAVIKLLAMRSSLLRCNVDSNMLSNLLKNICFVEPCKRIENYPECLPWASDNQVFWKPSELLEAKFANMIGSVKPIIHESMTDLSGHFGCNREPQPSDVICQLLKISDSYNDRYKPDVLPMISSIYKFLSNKPEHLCRGLTRHKWLWSGNGFEAADRVYIKVNSNDINIIPYMYPLPSEFTGYQQFFRKMGCPNKQSPQLLITVQKMIMDKYEKGGKTPIEAKTDLRLVINILNYLKDRDEHEIEGVLIPIKQDDDTKVVLYPVSECNYCRDEDEIYGDEKHFVHQDVSLDTAEKLRIQTVTDTLLDDAERLEEWGQSEPLTRRIKNLLESYKDGLSVPKEIIQNADDAGATKVCFMYDEREKESYGKKLLSTSMLECQGPSLWAYNNAVFTDQDLLNITKVSGATKQEDLSKIGKFGLGFCSVYNLTEVPSFVTGKNMVIFDPHFKYLGVEHRQQTGLKIDFQRNRKILERKPSQFQPFDGVFGCNLQSDQRDINFNGTLFRLPLRTHQQAVVSEISDLTYDRNQMNSLLKIFCEAGGNLLLFTQNVSSVEFYHLRNGENPLNASLVHSINREIIQCIDRPLSSADANKFSILKELSKSIWDVRNGKMSDFPPSELTLLLQISIRVGNQLLDFKINGESSSTAWIVAWASGTDKSKSLTLKSTRKGVLPLASVACPIELSDDNIWKTVSLDTLPYGYYKTSHIFCYLPLPVETDLPVYINGSFAVTSDRRRLSCKTTDDKESFESEWNEALMTDAVCNAYFLFLQRFNEIEVDSSKPYHESWPLECGTNGNMGQFQTSFYNKIVDNRFSYAIFRRDETICSFQKCKFLDSGLLETKVGEEVFNVCVKQLENDMTKIIKLPRKVQTCFKKAQCEQQVKKKTLTVLDFFSELVFPHLEDGVWDEAVRDLLLLYALDNASAKMCELLKGSKCIPTSPNGLLRYPEELVDRNSSVGGLFSEEDERFVQNDVNKFGKESRITTLRRLGMKTHTLSDTLIIDRAFSVANLSKTCSQCAIDRCSNLVRYLDTKYSHKSLSDELLSKLSDIKFLPVVNKPMHWKWHWAGDNVELVANTKTTNYTCNSQTHTKDLIRFECGKRLYSKTVEDLVCAVKPVLDRSKLPYSVYLQFLKHIGMQETVSPALVFENLLAISQIPSGSEVLTDEVQLINVKVFAAYKHLNTCFEKVRYSDDEKRTLLTLAEKYQEEKIIFLNGLFVAPNQIVVHCSEDCSPHFYRLNASRELRNLTGLLELFKIDNMCFMVRILKELQTYINNFHNTDVEMYVRLLRVLVQAMEFESVSKEAVANVLIPDEEGVLRPITEVCIDDSTVTSMESMHFTHEKISFNIADAIGIKSKRRQKVDKCTVDLYSADFGQHEELITRIKRILSGYPCDGGILKELVQNADDAGALEVHIVVDYNHYPTDNLFDTSWEQLQGPAILVYNDQHFTQADIEGIQKLGTGSKGEDPTKTGQYGVGFNAVYHLTDVPSFLTRGKNVETGEILGVFDPHCKYVPKATTQNPGRKYVNTQHLREDHPNVFSCYRDDLLMEDQGTIFRLPLRTSRFACQSSISNKAIDETIINSIVENFKDEMQDMLLFVSHVKSLRISRIKNGSLENIYSVKRTVSNIPEERIQDYNNAIRKSSIMQNNGQVENIPTLEIQLNVDIDDSMGNTRKWLVIRRIGFSGKSSCPEIILRAIQNKELGLLPRGGVAIPINDKKCDIKSRVFCFLPIPVETGLPVHFNGHFALDHEARRNLWFDDHEDYRTAWNKYLLRDVVAPAYVSGLIKLVEMLGWQSDHPINQGTLRKHLDKFHSYFPDVEKVKGDYCFFLTFSIYRWINAYEIPLFPSAIPVSRSEASVRFYPLTCSDFQFPCVFNTLMKKNISVNTAHSVSGHVMKKVESLSEKTDCDKKHIPALIQILKKLGIKLLESPKHIRKSMKASDIAVQEISSDFLIQFLKSYDSEHIDKCQLQEIDTDVKETVFNKAENVCICLEYCRTSKTFNSDIEGLPLCLTQDEVLRTFNSKAPVFLSLYSSLVKESTRMFIHEDLYDTLDLGMVGTKPFDIQALADILCYTLNPDKYRKVDRQVPWGDSEQIPNVQWLKKVWSFISSEVTSDNALDGHADTEENETLEQKIKDLLHWNLIPSMLASGETVLYPVRMAKHVLDIETFSGKVNGVLQRLALPRLDIKFNHEHSVLRNLLASNRSPDDLLNFLYEYRHEIQNRNPNVEDCNCILEHLGQHLDELFQEQENEGIVINKMKAIPLHVTVDNHSISIEDVKKVLALDESSSKQLVPNGIDEWVQGTQTTLLRTTKNLTPLYVKLGITESNSEVIDVYINHLLPQFRFLPRHAHIPHLEYIRDKLLAVGYELTNKQTNLIATLKSVAFVPDNQNILYKASHFKNFSDVLLKEMCDQAEFPAFPFCEVKWFQFLVNAGLQTDVTSAMVVNFAKVIEEDGRRNLTDTVTKRSKMLVNHILSRTNLKTENVLEQISSIKFVIPKQVIQSKIEIFPQCGDGLISYRTSVMESKEDLCWTTLPIVSDNTLYTYNCTLPKKEVVKKLGVLEDPSLNNVLNHIQNVCDRLKDLSSTNRFYDSMVFPVKDIMVKMYEWITKHKDADQENVKRALSKKPFIFIPDRKLIVNCENVVRGLDKQLEIVPYLMGVPDEYGMFFQTFQLLGMSMNVNICNYVRVLSYLKLDVQDNKLNPNQLTIVKVALKQILGMASNVGDDTSELEAIGPLYLLSREQKLVSAKEMVLSDNQDIEQKIGTDIGKPFMMSPDQLEIFGTASIALKRLPLTMQPFILSEMINEELDENGLCKVSDGRGGTLRNFIESLHFCEAIVRISVHGWKESSTARTMKIEEEVEQLLHGLERLNITQVESIHLTLKYKGKDVGYNEKTAYCMKEDENGEITLLCAFKDLGLKDWLFKNMVPLSIALSRCTKYKFSDKGGYLTGVLAHIDNPDNISKALDEVKIPQYSVSKRVTKSVFPPCGTTVAEEWHCYLDNNFSDFEVGEYIALLISEERREGERFIPAVYIYAKIVQKFAPSSVPRIGNALRHYEVDVGNSRKERKAAFDCYKFNRRTTNESYELVEFLNVAENQHDDRPMDEIKREIRETIQAAWTLPEEERKKIIKRLYKKWHPDKNYGNEEMTTEIFKYLQDIVLRMERGEDINSNADAGFREPPRDSPFWEYFRTWSRDAEEDKNYSRRQHNRGSRSGCHRQTREEVPSAAEARQWMRQARADFRAAEIYLPHSDSGPHFNWICLICYQCVEKVLKALHFNKDSNNIPAGNDLLVLTRGLPHEIREMVEELVGVVGPRDTSRLMYPDRLSVDRIPADEFGKRVAEGARDISKRILEFGNDYL